MFFIVVGELFRMIPEQLETVLNEAGQSGLAK
jgi:hypothetical protein